MPASGQPGHGALDLPPVPAQPLGGLHTLAGQAVDDPAFAEPAAQVVVVVSLVSVQFGGPAPPRPAAGADRREPRHQGLAGPGCRGCWPPRSPGQGQPCPVGDQVDLRPFLAPVDRIRTCPVPLRGPACSPSRSRTATRQLTAGTELLQDQAVELRPDPSPGPLGERPVRGGSGGTEHRRELGPGAAAGGHEDDRGQHLAVAVSAPATALGTCGLPGRHRWNSSHSSSDTSRSTIDTGTGYREPK